MRSIALIFAALMLAALPGFGSAQGNGGSQTPCELQYSTCKITAQADYQFCLNASQGSCQDKLDAALRNCDMRQSSCTDND